MPKKVAQNHLFSQGQGKGAVGFVEAIGVVEVIGTLDLNNRFVWLSVGCLATSSPLNILLNASALHST